MLLMMELIRNVVAAFLGTLGFSVLLQAPRKALLTASWIGSATYGIYWLLHELDIATMLAMFTAAAAGSVMAQLAARRKRMVATIFIALAIIPLVPGLGLYRCMAYLAQGQSALGAQTGLEAMGDVLMIALGIGVGTFLPRRRQKKKTPTDP